MGYTPEQFSPVENLQQLEDVVYRELTRIKEALDAVDAVILPKLHVEPTKVLEGQLAYADGTDWDPGAGQGIYQWRTSAWVLIN